MTLAGVSTIANIHYASNTLQCVRLAAGRRTQASDATDQWRAIHENQLIFDEVKAYKKLCQVFGPP